MSDRATTLNTKRMLARALRDQMAAKPLGKVTVTELVAASGVSRKTFYYHFTDVPDLLEWLIEDEAIDVVRQFALPDAFGDALNFTLHYVERNRAFLRNAYAHLGTDKLRLRFESDFEGLVRAFVDSRTRRPGEDSDYREFLVHFCTEAIATLTIDWLLERSAFDRPTLVRYAEAVMRRLCED